MWSLKFQMSKLRHLKHSPKNRQAAVPKQILQLPHHKMLDPYPLDVPRAVHGTGAVAGKVDYHFVCSFARSVC